MTDDATELIKRYQDYLHWRTQGSVFAPVSEHDWQKLTTEQQRAELEDAHFNYRSRFDPRSGRRAPAVSSLGREVEEANIVSVTQTL